MEKLVRGGGVVEGWHLFYAVATDFAHFRSFPATGKSLLQSLFLMERDMNTSFALRSSRH